MDTAEAEGELRDALARLLRERCDIEQVRGIAAAPGGWDRQLWSELAAMGVVGLAAPAEHGGEGAGLALLAVAQEELGRRVAPVPLLSSAIAQAALLAVVDGIAPGAAAAGGLLPAVASGQTPAAIAVGRTVDGWTPLATVRAEQAAGGCQLTGTAPVVADATAARALLVAATTDTGPALFAVDVPPRPARARAVVMAAPLGSRSGSNRSTFPMRPARSPGSPWTRPRPCSPVRPSSPRCSPPPAGWR